MRNDGVCVRCGSISRHRHLAQCVLEEFRERGIAGLSDFGGRDDIFVFNASSRSPIARRLGTSKNIVNSEYFDDCTPGELKNGIVCQDLEQLTFRDDSVDLVITEDVFEHVRDWRKGFSEVFRVLKKNGLHVFSIPFYFDRKTKELFTLKNGRYELLEPVEYHGDPVRGSIPAYQHFGYDLFDFLWARGFAANVRISQYADNRAIATDNSYTFVTKKV